MESSRHLACPLKAVVLAAPGQLSGGRSQYDLSIPRTLSGLSLCSIMPVIVHKRLRVSARCGYRLSMVPRILLADFGLGEQWTVVGVKH